VFDFNTSASDSAPFESILLSLCSSSSMTANTLKEYEFIQKQQEKIRTKVRQRLGLQGSSSLKNVSIPSLTQFFHSTDDDKNSKALTSGNHTIEHKLKKIIYKTLLDPNLVDPPLAISSLQNLLLEKNPELKEELCLHFSSIIQELATQHTVLFFDEIEVSNKIRPVILDIDRSKLFVLIKTIFNEWYQQLLKNKTFNKLFSKVRS
jgi:hypothetical protein